MTDALIVEVLRGDRIESRHLVDVVVVDASGSVVDGWGDPGRQVLARSALKPIQALPLAESGAADAWSVTEEELAIACGSHGGEPAHVAVVEAWLDRLGLDIGHLECGAHAPTHKPSAAALVVEQRFFDARHNNCSGKHCGFLCVCTHLDLPTGGYVAPEHRLHADHVTPAVEELCGLSLKDQIPTVDGCGIPVWSIPLVRLAAGWAALPSRPGGRRLLDAMTARPEMVAGTGRACTALMVEGAGRIAVKPGAEGVYCAVDLDSGVAVALKAHDGARRASEAVIAWVLGRLGVIGEQAPTMIRNWAGTEVGGFRVTG